MSTVQVRSGWITKDKQTLDLGPLRDPRDVVRVHIHVTQAFNSDGSDQISVGHETDDDAYATATDVSSTGIKTPSAGTGVGFDGTERNLIASYANSGTEPTTGKAFIAVEFLPAPPSL